MKYLTLISICFFLIACSSTQPITKTQTKETVSHTEVKEIPKTLEQSILITADTSAVSKTITKPVKVVKVNSENPELKKNALTTHLLWNQMLQKHVSNSGQVNYSGFKTEKKKLSIYINTLSKAYADKSFQTLSREKKLAFWINAYNAMTVDLILRNYPIKSIKDIDKPWGQRFWKLGGKWFNLNDIEHNILRKMDEPRIHFAIVCASISCPKLHNKAFIATKIEAQLTQATKEFLSDSERNELSEKNIKISKIFQWFAKDFKQNGSLIDFLNQYTDIDISAKAKKSFKDYNWGLNE